MALCLEGVLKQIGGPLYAGRGGFDARALAETLAAPVDRSLRAVALHAGEVSRPVCEELRGLMGQIPKGALDEFHAVEERVLRDLMKVPAPNPPRLSASGVFTHPQLATPLVRPSLFSNRLLSVLAVSAGVLIALNWAPLLFGSQKTTAEMCVDYLCQN